jgi:hypothetical protein
MVELVVKLELPGRIGLLQITEMEFAEAPQQYLHWKKEAWTAGHPTAAVQGDSSTGTTQCRWG